ncbi:hypothetical protein [Nocardiopsis tropica]|uniref:Uncharacterized protein n=1 Tax=Nocardiopsis tropica TaxID=109330 RepID=A0ABU7KMU6_9ACTN|nr:hypothetical protein [Nocardiopsis umidischolae]MEE2050339.1 hypothetical protein [Nocardiopsis umidischolae]
MSRADWDDPADLKAMATTWATRKAARAEGRAARFRLRARVLLSRIPPDWLEAATTEPCRQIVGGSRCGRKPTRLHREGRRCFEHAPVAITYTRKDDPRG